MKNTLVWSVVLYFFNLFRVWFCIFSTRFECGFTSSPLVSSVFFSLDDFIDDVEDYDEDAPKLVGYNTKVRNEGTSSPLVSSVVTHLLHSFRV